MLGKQRPRPAVLLVLDGFGIAPDAVGNAVTRANMPNYNRFVQRYPAMALKANGEAVGLMWGEMGNSQVGHLTIGSGRVSFQALPRIEREIDSGNFMSNEELLKAIEFAKENGRRVHVLGICSSGKVHGHIRHMISVLEFCKKHKMRDVAVHVILDGRDTLYSSGLEFVRELKVAMRKFRTGYIASISGRFYAMDRDNRWDRTEKAYRAIVLGEADAQFDDAEEAIKDSYAREVYDEEFVPVVIKHKGEYGAPIEAGDSVIFTNYRSDRARQITKALALPQFDGFERTALENVYIATMTEYENGLPVHVIFPNEDLKNTLAEVLSNAGLVQLHIAETEKYAHVTFFFNGAHEQPFPQEDRVIIPSPRVSSYAEKPEMSTPEIARRIVKEIETGNYDVIIANFANPDMVAHTGNFDATVKAHESVDAALGDISEAVLAAGGVLLITADHGNSEEVANLQTGEMDKEHSTNPVPFLIISNELEGQSGLSGDVPNGDLALLPPIGMLADVAPTLLAILGIEQPPEMTGTPLIDLD